MSGTTAEDGRTLTMTTTHGFQWRTQQMIDIYNLMMFAAFGVVFILWVASEVTQ